MQNQYLHPNLARIAAAYDSIVERYGRGELPATRARAEVLALRARDDNGVLWSICPDTGAWQRRTIAGDLVSDTPPAYGLATPTAHDLTPGGFGFNPDTRVAMTPVDETLLFPPSSLSGATRRPQMVEPPAAGKRRRVLWVVALLVTVTAARAVVPAPAADVPAPAPQVQLP